MSRKSISHSVLALCFLALSTAVLAETCTAGSEMDAASKSSVDAAAHQMFQQMQQGDVFSLKQNSIPALSSNFGSIEQTIVNNKPRYATANLMIKNEYLLDAPGTAPIARAEFLCGVWGQPDFTTFVLPNLPPGRYAIVVSDLSGQTPSSLSLILQQQGTAWKLAGYYPQPPPVGGHDGNWFLQQARSYKAKGQNRIAWFYYLEARELLVPVSFMYTQSTDKAYDEMQTVKPSDLPPFDLSGAGKTYKVMDMFPVVVGSDLDLVVKYQSASVSDTGQTFQENMAVMKALLTKYPELRDAFAGIVARATEPSGKDYGSLMAMKDIK